MDVVLKLCFMFLLVEIMREMVPLEFLCFPLVLPQTGTQALALSQVYHLCSSSVISVSFLFFKTCSESVRARAAKSAWLGDLFLPNITLFMDRRYFSDSEWNRLEHFVPPFGFMDLNYSRESLRACQDGTFRLPTGTWKFAASPHQRHESRRISWWKL